MSHEPFVQIFPRSQFYSKLPKVQFILDQCCSLNWSTSIPIFCYSDSFAEFYGSEDPLGLGAHRPHCVGTFSIHSLLGAQQSIERLRLLLSLKRITSCNGLVFSYFPTPEMSPDQLIHPSYIDPQYIWLIIYSAQKFVEMHSSILSYTYTRKIVPYKQAPNF